MNLMMLAQGDLDAEQDTTGRIIVDYSDLAEFLNTNGAERQILTGNVELHQDSTFMYCDRAELSDDNRLTAIGEVLIQQTDSVFLFSDSLYYYGNTEMAELFGNVSLVNKEMKLFTSELFYNLKTREASYEKTALLTDGKAKMISKTGTYYVNEKLAVFRDSVVIIDSNFILKTDSLHFNTVERICYFVGPTVIVQEDARIYCESGYYNLETREALFSKNAEYRNGDQYSTGDTMIYYANGGEIDLIGNAVFRDSTREATADRIRFWQDSEVAMLKGNAIYVEDGRKMISDSIYYDGENEKFYSNGKSQLWNGAQYIEADEIDFPSGKEWGFAKGDVIWKDTVQNTILYAQWVNYNQEDNFMKALPVDGIRPYMVSIMDGDSLWMSADTLYSYEKEDSLTLDPIRIIQAYHAVRAYKSNLQVVCDSMSYDGLDSMFYFYDNPIMWSDTSQFIADTISVALLDGTIDRVFLDKNAMILNSPDEIYFNQMKGRNIVAVFDSSELRKLLINGNAQSIYYALDEDNAYMGVNESVCSNMLVYFGNNEIDGIKFYTAPESVMSPMNNINHDAIRLDGFRWEIKRRPKSKADIIQNFILIDQDAQGF